MSRLIDIEDIAICGWYMEDDEGEVYIKLSDVEKCIDKAPTAYDVEAVVRELEEKSNGFFADDEEFGEMFVKTIPLPLAIEIVRGGRNE